MRVDICLRVLITFFCHASLPLSYHIPLRGSHVVVLGRSASVGLPLSLLLLSRCATVTNIDQTTPLHTAKALCRQADVLIAAVGVPEYVKADWVKPGAAVVDVGINFVPRTANSNGSNGSSNPAPQNPLDTSSGMKLVGDVAFSSVAYVAGFLSPVPGGVGPMTVAMLMDNTLRGYIRGIQCTEDAFNNKGGSTHAAVEETKCSESQQQQQQTHTTTAAATTDAAFNSTNSPLPSPLSRPPYPMLFLSGGPGAGKGTQASLLVAEHGLVGVRGCDGNDRPTPHHSAKHRYVELQDGRRFGVVHISVGALLRQQMSNPSPDCQLERRTQRRLHTPRMPHRNTRFVLTSSLSSCPSLQCPLPPALRSNPC